VKIKVERNIHRKATYLDIHEYRDKDGQGKIKVEKNMHSKLTNKWICSRWIDRQQKYRKVEG
jgi:hypothetical protein